MAVNRSSAFRYLLGAVVVTAGMVGGCGRAPTEPTPPPTAPPVVTPPVINGISVSVTRTEVDRDVIVRALVQDAEKPVEQLAYVWSATVGSVTGTGPSVTWRLGKGTTQTPVDVVIAVTVIEPYQALENGRLVSREHRITRQAAPFRVHDSTEEISRMAVRFLVDLFGNSSLSADQCLVDFWPACPDTEREREDIVDNRAERLITSVEARVERITFNGEMTTADVEVPCTFRDIDLASGSRWRASGTCEFSTVYHDARWWLCSSQFVDYTVTPAAVAGASRPISDYWLGSVPDGVP